MSWLRHEMRLLLALSRTCLQRDGARLPLPARSSQTTLKIKKRRTLTPPGTPSSTAGDSSSSIQVITMAKFRKSEEILKLFTTSEAA